MGARVKILITYPISQKEIIPKDIKKEAQILSLFFSKLFSL